MLANIFWQHPRQPGAIEMSQYNTIMIECENERQARAVIVILDVVRRRWREQPKCVLATTPFSAIDLVNQELKKCNAQNETFIIDDEIMKNGFSSGEDNA